VLGITYPSDRKQITGDGYVSAVSADGQAYSMIATLEGAADKPAGIARVKQGLERYLQDIKYDDPTETKRGALVVTGTGKAKKAGVPVVFATGVFETGRRQLAGVAFVVDARIEEYYKETTALQPARKREISAFQVRQELGAFGRGSGLPHDLAPVNRLALTLGLTCAMIRQQILDEERSRVGGMGIQGQQQRRSFLDDPNPAWRWPWIRRSCPLGKRNHRSRSRLSGTWSRSSPPVKRPARKLRITLTICSWI
jgi:hypothetical protein